VDSLPTGSRAGGVQTLDRAVAVLDAVAALGRAGLAELVEATGLARPTAHRLAVALERQGLLDRDGEGRFRLGRRLVAWGAAARREFPLADAAAPVLAALAEETGESAQLWVRDGDRRVCVAVHERPSGLRDTVPLGAVFPLTAGSGAKVLLAWGGDAARFGHDAHALAAVRSRGWADSVAEREAGVASVSAPVRDGADRVVAAISVSGPIDRLGRRPGRHLAPAVVAAATRLSAS
jgi:DNA-binding IclR family transcriptional regulator